MELDSDGGQSESLAERLVIREKALTPEKALSETQKNNLRLSRGNLARLREEIGADGRSSRDGTRAGRTPPLPLGVAFDVYLERHDNLPERIAATQRLLPCLSNLNTFRYLNRLGFPVLVPEGRSQVFLFRLGLLDRTSGAIETQLEACRVAESIAVLLKRSALEIDLWIRAYVGRVPELSPVASLCRSTPHCDACDLQTYCHYYRFRRPQVSGGTVALPIKEWRPSEQPRERLLHNGAEALQDVELLAIVLRTGTRQCNVLELARRLLEHFGSLSAIEEASIEELRKVHGIGNLKAIELKAVLELGRRLVYRPLQPGQSIESSNDVYRSYGLRLAHRKQEEFILLMLDNKNQVIREEVVSRGGLDASIVHPREVFKVAIRASAASVIFVHNHPSGDPTPSHDDFVITQRLEEAAEFLKIQVLDHVIVGAGRYYSFTDGETVDVPIETVASSDE
ncbi:DNA repair protein RadC [Candidatus Sumerlaeota bacterium]|nr:DNA repair protein RadC [Candidatus Sumerlaeota bacterium]